MLQSALVNLWPAAGRTAQHRQSRGQEDEHWQDECDEQQHEVAHLHSRCSRDEAEGECEEGRAAHHGAEGVGRDLPPQLSEAHVTYFLEMFTKILAVVHAAILSEIQDSIDTIDSDVNGASAPSPSASEADIDSDMSTFIVATENLIEQ